MFGQCLFAPTSLLPSPPTQAAYSSLYRLLNSLLGRPLLLPYSPPMFKVCRRLYVTYACRKPSVHVSALKPYVLGKHQLFLSMRLQAMAELAHRAEVISYRSIHLLLTDHLLQTEKRNVSSSSVTATISTYYASSQVSSSFPLSWSRFARYISALSASTHANSDIPYVLMVSWLDHR